MSILSARSRVNKNLWFSYRPRHEYLNTSYVRNSMMFWIRFAGIGDFSDLGEDEILERFRIAFTANSKRKIRGYVFLKKRVHR